MNRKETKYALERRHADLNNMSVQMTLSVGAFLTVNGNGMSIGPAHAPALSLPLLVNDDPRLPLHSGTRCCNFYWRNKKN